MKILVANITGSATRKTFNGKPHLVVPATLIVPGVLNGSKGALLYPPEEIAASTLKWNSIPLVKNHPVDNAGQPVSARSPEVLEKHYLGLIFNSKSEGKLVAEAWFDIAAANKVDPRIISRLERGEKIELSTGLFTTNTKGHEDPTLNVWVTEQGVTEVYKEVATKFIPDHVAVLTDDIGACSIQKGCGVLVGNKLTENSSNYAVVRDAIVDQLVARFNTDDKLWIEDIYSDHVIVNQGEKLYHLDYKETESGVNLSTKDPVEVVKQDEYKPVTNKGDSMSTKEKLVSNLIANCNCWDETDTEVLNTFSEEKLKALTPAKESVEPAKPAEPAEPATPAEPVANAAPSSQETVPAKPLSFDESLQTLHPEIQEVIVNAMADSKARKTELINKLVANVAEADQAAKKEILVNKSVSELEEIVGLLPTPAPATTHPRQALYLSGNNNGSESQQVNNESTEADKEDCAIMAPPVLNFEEISNSHNNN